MARKQPHGPDAGRRRSSTTTSGRTSRPPTRTTFVDPAIEEVRKVRYARDESLDPQLVWRGKYPPADEIGEADIDLVTDAPPIYIQEKIDPRVLIENLRRTAERPEDEPELTLFDVVRRARRAGPGRLLQARRQLVEPHDPRRLASR